MAQFDFDKIIDRRNTNCVKWDECAEGVIPMWVADMDFQVAPAITEALRQRVEHGVFGYTLVPEDYNILLFVLPPGAFITLGFLVAIMNKLRSN